MIDGPSIAELCELVDFLWAERHDQERSQRFAVPPSETPLFGWTLDYALRHHGQRTDSREREARDLYDAEMGGEIRRSLAFPWPDLSEEDKNRWRVRVQAPTYRPMGPRPR